MNEWEWQLLEETAPVESVTVEGVEVKKGDSVRLRPRQGGDIFDLALAGQIALVESHRAGLRGQNPTCGSPRRGSRQGSRGIAAARTSLFLFAGRMRAAGPAPVRASAPASKILVAGIGNIFLGDDGFGVEVARRLKENDFPDGVRVQDFGIRSYDLAYALLDGYDLTILVDAVPRASPPGTLYVIEPEIEPKRQWRL